MLKTNIPFIDLRGKTPTDLLRAFPDKATALIDASKNSFGIASRVGAAVGLPWADKKSRGWLKKSANPYLHEIETAASILGKRGVYTLNLAYEWGCTSGVYLTAGQIEMLRVLDWPFPALGQHMVVALQSGPAGEYYNVTWPAISGVYQAMAPGRFSAAINQAPMRMHGLGFAGDWVLNRITSAKARGLPPAHLLRIAFERAAGYDQAKEILCKTPVALPVIYVLGGLRAGEGCIIERLEGKAEIKELSGAQFVSASNEFHSSFARIGKGWRPRALESAGRYRQSEAISTQDLQQEQFGWLKSPMINPLTRLVAKMNAGTGTLTVQGFEGQATVTNPYILPAPLPAAA